MTKNLAPALTILVIALVAGMSLVFRELPQYPVSAVHPFQVFLAGILAWAALSTAATRRSRALFSASVALGFLCLAPAFFPDLWLRWPLASLTGLAIGQAIAFAVKPSTPLRSALVAGAALVASLLPLISTVYFPWPVAIAQVTAAASLAILIAATAWAWKRRQRKGSMLSAASALAALATIALFVAPAFFPQLQDLPRRMITQEILFAILLILAGIAIIEQVHGERSLRTGPHMSLDTSLRDALTGIANRRALETYGPPLIAQSHDAGRAASVIICDIDHFKQINDIHGHQSGDIALKAVSGRLTAQVRKSDLVARYGGEEFIVILPGSPLAPALRLAERMRAAIEADPIPLESTALRLTASFGVATSFPENPRTMAELIHRADDNLYRAKREGRNLVRADDFLRDEF